MSEPEALSEVRRWLRYAQEDLRTAEALLAQKGIPPRHICWLAQQAAEKALKAILVFLQVDFPKIHDLDALRNLLPDGWKVKSEHSDLADLSEWAVEARYPGDWPEADEAEAISAVERARAILKSVSDDLCSHGFWNEETK
jgi:HEPN domain-containing protein